MHLREWLVLYRDIPSSISGADVVRIGFPLNAVASVLVALLLVASAFAGRKLRVAAVASAGMFQVASLLVLVLSRYGGVGGWVERDWTRGATQTLALEIGALALLALMTVVVAFDRRTGDGHVPRSLAA